MPKMFADLHCHPAMYGFNRMRNVPELELDPDRFHLWYPLPENQKDMSAGERSATYCQSDLPKLAKARGRLMFASITPIEKEFFGFPEGDERHHSFIVELFLLLTLVTPIRALFQWLTGKRRKALNTLVAILQNHGPLRALSHQLIMGYSSARIAHLQSTDFDYWEEYLKEYQFYKNKDGIPTQTSLAYTTPDGNFHQEKLTGCYHLLRDRDQLSALFDDPELDDIALVLTIEGSHVVSMDTHSKRVPDDVLFERIEALKTQPDPIFFILTESRSSSCFEPSVDHGIQLCTNCPFTIYGFRLLGRVLERVPVL